MKKNTPEHNNRPSWDEYFLIIVNAISKRATCNRGKSGCVITRDNRILATGYVGAPSNVDDCDSKGHLFRKMINEKNEISEHCVRTIHAEQNALIQAARYGISVDNSTLYCTMVPCFTCAKLILGSGVTRVVSQYLYHTSEDTKELFKEANIELNIINNEILNYSNTKEYTYII